MTAESFKLALFLLIAYVPNLVLHEYGHAVAAARLGDPTPKRWGRHTLNPRPLIDPFGSVILPGLALILIASGRGFLPVFGYAKPMPLDASYLRDPKRGSLRVIWAGLAANLVVAVLGGIGVRLGLPGDACTAASSFLIVGVYMFVFQLMPIPGLDGSKLLVRVLPGRAREVYANLDQYLPLFMLVVFFLLAGPLLDIVDALSGTLLDLIGGTEGC